MFFQVFAKNKQKQVAGEINENGVIDPEKG